DLAEQADLKQACAEALVYLYRLKKAFPICVPRALLWIGLYLAQEGKSDKAHRYWQRGLSEAQRLELYYDQALLHYEIGRHLMPEHPVRADHLQRAVQLCEQIGAAFDGERARAALEAKPTDGAAQTATNNVLLEQFRQLAQISPLVNA